MVQVGESTPVAQSVEELKMQIKRLNSKGGQLKMELHDLAEGLPTDYEKIREVAERNYQLFKELDERKKQLKALEQPK